MPFRVLHVLSQRPSWTGSGVALEAIVRAAARAGWEQRVVVGTPVEDPAPDVGGLNASQVLPLVFGESPLDFALPGMSDVMPYVSSRFSELSGDQLTAYRAAWRDYIGSAIQDFQPHVIHGHHFWILSSLLKDIAGKIPIVTHCHGTGFRQMSLCPHLVDEVHCGCRRNDAFVVLHRGHAEFLERESGIAAEKIHVVGSGFRDEIFHSRGRIEGDPAIVYAGKLSDAKGVPWLLEVVQRMQRTHPQTVLHMAGSGAGTEAETIRDRIQRMPNVVLHDQLSQNDLADLFRRSAVFVLPSFYEGLPLVLVEAAACGCRLVSTALPGIVEQLKPALGDVLTLVDPPPMKSTDVPVDADLPEFVNQLERALAKSLTQPPARDTDQLVVGMTWEAIFQKLQTLWKNLIDARV